MGHIFLRNPPAWCDTTTVHLASFFLLSSPHARAQAPLLPRVVRVNFVRGSSRPNRSEVFRMLPPIGGFALLF